MLSEEELKHYAEHSPMKRERELCTELLALREKLRRVREIASHGAMTFTYETAVKESRGRLAAIRDVLDPDAETRKDTR